ncbi:hypothetical protein CEP52_008802 [Fusarium oligoseptatum]|uniref:Uncharacterized protein n=1 Tax=Fusarium oligoseptatum TaxID=2604345 RepID=A0A428TG06_9HYPO|nr:hypothetical protein CEP52_008802 [Fusarium oligoseptatum]
MTKPHQHRHARPGLTSEAWRVHIFVYMGTLSSNTRIQGHRNPCGTEGLFSSCGTCKRQWYLLLTGIYPKGEKSLYTQQRN